MRIVRKTAVQVGLGLHRAVDIGADDLNFIREFLRGQKWKWLDGERRTSDKRQHYLWRKENQAVSWQDFCQVWGDGSMIQTDREHLVMPYELFLVDGVAGQLWVSFITPQNKLVNVACVSEDMNKDYGNCFNGYALLPTRERIAKRILREQ